MPAWPAIPRLRAAITLFIHPPGGPGLSCRSAWPPGSSLHDCSPLSRSMTRPRILSGAGFAGDRSHAVIPAGTITRSTLPTGPATKAATGLTLSAGTSPGFIHAAWSTTGRFPSGRLPAGPAAGRFPSGGLPAGAPTRRFPSRRLSAGSAARRFPSGRFSAGSATRRTRTVPSMIRTPMPPTPMIHYPTVINERGSPRITSPYVIPVTNSPIPGDFSIPGRNPAIITPSAVMEV